MPEWFRPLIKRKGKTRTTHPLTPVHDLGPLPADYDMYDKARRQEPIGANCAYRREVFASYHYDPRLGPNRDTGLRGGEDVLLGRLLLRDGYRLRYCPDARVRHLAHPERMTEAYLRRAYYARGVGQWRMNSILRGSRRQKMFKFYRKLALQGGKVIILRLQLLLLDLLFWRGRYATTRMRWLGEYELNRGGLAELRKWNLE
jgi:GT2 family glycosyltransferase